MKAGAKAEVLRHLTFGNQVAEEEQDSLREYFVRTQAWDRIYNGDIDVIYGPKGAGKSALYVLIQNYISDLFDRRVLLISAESPRGAPAFKDLNVDPPTSEREFVIIWKLYLLSLTARTLQDFGIHNEESNKLCAVLEEHKLLPRQQTTLGSILRAVRSYVTRMLNPKVLEAELKLDPHSGAPVGVVGKIVFEEPAIAAQDQGYLSVDHLMSMAATALERAGYSAWFMIDRLDVAFDESSELERNALRALFRTYRDIRNHDRIKLKIFLRTDIWERITEEGLREATHISRDIHIEWNKASLQNLIVRRLLNNPELVQAYAIDKEAVLSSAVKQDELFAQLFPDQVEVGEKQSTTLDWILKRTADGTGESQPRDIILLLNKLCEVQNRRLERGEQEPSGEWLFERSAFKEALPALSEYRINRVIFAEYPQLRSHIEALREEKTEQNAHSLGHLWKTKPENALVVARQLRDVGFFEERSSRGEPTFWVPFVYRPALSMSQGKVDEIQSGTVDADADEG